MNIDELKAGRETDALVAERVMEFEKLNVEYFSTPECSERQIELEGWMAKVGIGYVGTYFIDVQRDFWIEAQSWKPSSDIRYAWQAVAHLMDSGIGLPEICHDGQLWVVTVRDFGKATVVASGETAPLAISRAALKAVMDET